MNLNENCLISAPMRRTHKIVLKTFLDLQNTWVCIAE